MLERKKKVGNGNTCGGGCGNVTKIHNLFKLINSIILKKVLVESHLKTSVTFLHVMEKMFLLSAGSGCSRMILRKII